MHLGDCRICLSMKERGHFQDSMINWILGVRRELEGEVLGWHLLGGVPS